MLTKFIKNEMTGWLYVRVYGSLKLVTLCCNKKVTGILKHSFTWLDWKQLEEIFQLNKCAMCIAIHYFHSIWCVVLPVYIFRWNTKKKPYPNNHSYQFQYINIMFRNHLHVYRSSHSHIASNILIHIDQVFRYLYIWRYLFMCKLSFPV